MLLATVLALAIRQTNPRVAAHAETYAVWVLEEAEEHDLDPWLFQAIIYKESRWTANALRYEGDGTCSVGLGQINTRCEEAKITPLQNARTNLRKMGEFLSLIRDACRSSCADFGWLRAYNPGDPAYVRTIAAAVRKYHASEDGPDFRQVQPSLYPLGLFWVLRHPPCHHCWPPVGFVGSL